MLGHERRQNNIMAGETLAILIAMKSIRKAKGGATYTGTKITLPVDNESGMKKIQTIEHKEYTELMNEANLLIYGSQYVKKINTGRRNSTW